MAAISENDSRLVFVPIEKATTPPAGIIEHLKDRYWCVHPEKGLMFWDKKHKAPQCNDNKSIAESFKKEMYPWCEIIFIPSVFTRVNINDYIDR